MTKKHTETNAPENTETADEHTPAPIPEEQVEHLTAEVLHWKDLALRTAADMENLRRRTQLDIQNARQYANADFAEDLLPVLDCLSNAITCTNTESEKADDKTKQFLTGVVQGLEMAQKQFLDVLKKNNVQPILSMGQIFNPDLHKVIQQIEDPSHPAGTIVQELQTGYTIGERVLRDAMVVVSK